MGPYLPGLCEGFSIIEIGKGYERLVSLSKERERMSQMTSNWDVRVSHLELEVEDRGH